MRDWVAVVGLFVVAALLLALSDLIFQVKRLQRIADRNSPTRRAPADVIDVAVIDPDGGLVPTTKERSMTR